MSKMTPVKHPKLVIAGSIFGVLAIIGAISNAVGGSSSSSNDSSLSATTPSAVGAAPVTTAVPAVSTTAPAPVNTHHHASSGGAQGCDASLWSHVYHSYRLHVVSQCKTVTGIVDSVKWEADGDTHFDLSVSNHSLANSVNDSAQHGDLVVEAICVGTVTQADAIGPCSGLVNHVTIPSAGDRVTVTGSYVLDADHGWMEIHPVTRLTITSHRQATGFAPPQETDAPATQAPAPPPATHTSCYPLTNGGNCYEPGEYCRNADAGTYGVAGDGERIYCTNRHWEPA